MTRFKVPIAVHVFLLRSEQVLLLLRHNTGFEDGNYRSRTKLGNYRAFRHRGGANRAVPIGTKRNANEVKDLPSEGRGREFEPTRHR